jgi:hypothetical protein
MSSVDDDELPGLAEDVVYELGMFDYAASELRRLQPMPHITTASTTTTSTISVVSAAGRRIVPSTPDPREQSAAVELLLLHARILRDFFADPPTADDDVVAEHYDADWHRRCAADPDASSALTVWPATQSRR